MDSANGGPGLGDLLIASFDQPILVPTAADVNDNFVLPVASTVVLTFFLYLFHMIYGYFSTSRGATALSLLFGQYVPRELVVEMSRDPATFTMASESREMSVLFSDVRGITGIAEALDPPDLSRLMTEYLTPKTKVVHRRRGRLYRQVHRRCHHGVLGRTTE